VYSGTPSAQQFTLLSSVIITSVDVAFEGTSSVNVLTMTIVSDSGNLPAGTLQATDSSDSGSTTSSAFSDVNFAFSSPMLSAGTYWLVISTTASVSAGEKWQDQSTLSTPAGEGGSIDGRLASNGATVNGFAFLTTINGSLATSTPEPTTIVTSLAALAAILLWRTKTA
jgi:hypothetical protein